MTDKNQGKRLILNENEQHLIKIVRDIQYGELHVFIAEGKPVRLEEIKKSIKL